jgi:GTPase Era involved in 16S rRNA processing
MIATADNELSAAGRAADPETLRTYTRRKLAIAAQLRALVELLKNRQSEARAKRCEELLVKLAEDRFTLAVVGQFKRGKSSLMNAIIGRELLPTGVLPLTSAITILKFGPAERLVVRRANSVFPEIVPVTALADYVTEKGNPANRKKVKTATLEVPLPFLRRGLEFVDTPGVGSAIEANTATTYRFLPECDAVLFVTSVDTPFTETELDFLHAIRAHVGKIFFILNKTDLLPDDSDLAEVLQFVESELRTEMETTQVRVFPLSARLALTPLPGAGSGLPALQETLAHFLAEEKSTVFLRAILDRALRILEEECGDLELARRARGLPEEVVSERMATLAAQWNELGAARQRLVTQLEENALQRARELAAPALDQFLQSESEGLRRELNRFIAHAAWSLGEEVAERWRERLSSRMRKNLAQWLRNLTPEIEAKAAPGAAMRQSLAENLNQIAAHAATTFDLAAAPAEKLLPPLGGHAAYDQRLDRLHLERSLQWFSFLPARLIRGSLRVALERELDDFLRNCRNAALAVIAAGVKRMAEQMAGQINETAAELQARLTSAIAGEAAAAVERRPSSGPRDAGSEESTLVTLREKLLALRADVDSSASGALEHAEAPSAPEASTASAPNEWGGRAEDRPSDLAQDLKTRGCAACDHLVKTAFDFLAHWQYAISADEQAQRQFAGEKGFCPLHMWQLHAVSSSLGESVGLARLAEQTATLLQDATASSEPDAAVRSLLRDGKSCRVCQLLAGAESDYIDRLAAFVSAAEERDSYARSQGLCLRHLARLLPHLSKPAAQFMVRAAARHFEENAEDMQNYAIKRDALRRALGNKDEEDAHVRALIHLAGAKDVCAPWPEDREI